MTKNQKKKKYPKLQPQFSKDAHGKIKTVYLKYDQFESIFQRIDDLEKKLDLKKSKKS